MENNKPSRPKSGCSHLKVMRGSDYTDIMGIFWCFGWVVAYESWFT